MVQHSSGVNVQISELGAMNWMAVYDAYFEEGKFYKWQCNTDKEIIIILQNIPLPMTKYENGWTGQFQMPFNSGKVSFTIICNGNKSVVKQYVYPDNRKVTNSEYMQMISDILSEAAVCFEYSGFNLNIESFSRTKECTWAQWNYIQNNFQSLKSIFNKIEERPIRRLLHNQCLTKRESLRKINQGTLSWIEKRCMGYKNSEMEIPRFVKEQKVHESIAIYENKVIKSYMLTLKKVLKMYLEYDYKDINSEIEKYINWINYKLNFSFLNNIKPHSGPIKVTQIFRKSPLYRFYYQWFDKLFKFQNYRIGFSYDMPLCSTYQIYEIWCYMMLVKSMRENNILKDTSKIFKVKNNNLFLTLGENHLSKVKLINNGNLMYQRVFQINSRQYYSFTQKMIPDIVLELNGELIVLDPKYRVENNIGNALAEMHKYRDGIVSREENKKIVKEAYILTSIERVNGCQDKNYFDDKYHNKYKMGAFCVKPFNENKLFKKFIGLKLERNSSR